MLNLEMKEGKDRGVLSDPGRAEGTRQKANRAKCDMRMHGGEGCLLVPLHQARESFLRKDVSRCSHGGQWEWSDGEGDSEWGSQDSQSGL